MVVLGAVALGVQQFMLKPKQEAAASATAHTVKTAKVSTGKLDFSVRLAGVTSSREYANITAPIMRGFESGRDLVLVYLIPTGSRVKKGQTLAQIDAKTLEDHIDDIADDIERAEADIRKRKAEQEVDMGTLMQNIKVAKSDFEKASLDARAAEVRTEVERELLKLSAEEAEARYKQVQADVQHKKAAHAAELVILDITKKRHYSHRDRHKSDLVKYTMRSPMDGMAVTQQVFRGSEFGIVQQGDQVTPGQLFMKVVNPDKMQVEANINQAESSMFRIGQKSAIKLDAFPGLTLPGHVYSIAALAAGSWRQQYYLRNIPVRIAIDTPNEKLIPDLSGSCDVMIEASAEGSRIAPLAGVFEDGGKTVAYVKNSNGGFDKREIKLGLKNSTHAVITDGLKDGEELAVEPPVTQVAKL